MRRILVIDDDRLVAKSLGRLLETQGYGVTVTMNGQEALEAVAKLDFDLIISDIRMPDIDGVETIQKIRATLKEKGKAQIPEIFITGYVEGPSHEEAKKLYTSDFIYKPFDKEKFLTSIDKALRES